MAFCGKARIIRVAKENCSAEPVFLLMFAGVRKALLYRLFMIFGQ
jgi:hypothetical protein